MAKCPLALVFCGFGVFGDQCGTSLSVALEVLTSEFSFYARTAPEILRPGLTLLEELDLTHKQVNPLVLRVSWGQAQSIGFLDQEEGDGWELRYRL